MCTSWNRVLTQDVWRATRKHATECVPRVGPVARLWKTSLDVLMTTDRVFVYVHARTRCICAVSDIEAMPLPVVRVAETCSCCGDVGKAEAWGVGGAPEGGTEERVGRVRCDRCGGFCGSE